MEQTFNRRSARLLVVFILVVTALGVFPITPARAAVSTVDETFSGDSEAPGWTLLGSASLTHNIDGWLQLTSNTNVQAGAAFYTTAFIGDSAFDVEFDYATWGGDGADGLTFFMIDGTVTPTATGNVGGFLGYGGDNTVAHIAGAYFAVSFDEYSNGYDHDSNIGIYAPGNYTPSPTYQVNSTSIPASREAPNHVHIVFQENQVSVWLNEVSIISDYSLVGILPESLKFGFSGGTGGQNNYHEIRNAVITVTPPLILRVTTGGSTDYPCGDSWGDDACSLQTALLNAPEESQIWVAGGVYKPTTGMVPPADVQTATFQLPVNVTVYGGFDGVDDTLLSDRNPVANPTILSGDIDNNDTDEDGNQIDETTEDIQGINSYHVVTGGNGSTLDGFIITGGYAGEADFFCLGNGCGGGMVNNNISIVVKNNIFSGNYSYGYGGGMLNTTSSAVISQVTFTGNDSGHGGGLSNRNSSFVEITNSTFSGNSTRGNGGAIHNEFVTHASISNSTFSGNEAVGLGGALRNYNSDVLIRNSILWANTSSDGIQIADESSTINASYSVVQGGYEAGSNIFSTDPKLGAFGDHGGSTPTIPIKMGSSAQDSGDSTNCPPYDQRKVARPLGGGCDIGAYEYNYAGPYFVSTGATDAGTCESWVEACKLQTALVHAAAGEIWVASGIYYPTEITDDRAASFQLREGIEVYGGFDGLVDDELADRDLINNGVVLSGDIDGNDSQWPGITDLEIVTGNDTNSYHVVKGANNATLDGFIITAGYTLTDSGGPDYCGGGMLNDGTSPIVRNVTFVGNQAYDGGGGMGNYNYASPVVEQSTFMNNASSYYGGGMTNYLYSNPTITNVTFTGNTATYGGAVENLSSDSTFTNVTFSGNTSTYGSVYFQNGGNPVFRNTIFWANSSTDGNVFINNGNTITVNDSVIQGGCPPMGVTCNNTFATDPYLGELGLYGGFSPTFPISLGSSAIDHGNNEVCPTVDQRWVSRPQALGCDIGAFEGEFYPVLLPLIHR